MYKNIYKNVRENIFDILFTFPLFTYVKTHNINENIFNLRIAKKYITFACKYTWVL